MLIGPKMTFQS